MAEYEIKSPMWTKDGTLYRPGKREVSAAHAKELGLGKSGEAQTQEGGDGDDPLAGVDFASAAARTAAEEAGLSAADFKDAKGSSADGFTKPDVMALIEVRG